jgi:YegS/Rv2252/BmrU family lipid kinase
VEVAEEVPVQRLDRLRELVAQPRAEPLLVLAAGGDGTVGAVADVLADTGHLMAVLPLGTSNDFARSLRVPVDVEEAVALLGRGKVSTIDLGRLDVPGEAPRHFVHAATAGVNVSFASIATRASFRRRLGRLAYLAAAVLALQEIRPFRCRLSWDGHAQELELIQLSVINAPVFGGFLGMRVRSSSLGDRLLDLLAVEDVRPWRMVGAGLLGLLPLRRPLGGIRSYRMGRVEVHTDRPLQVALDGEPKGWLPATFVAAAEALRVVVPQDFEDMDEPGAAHLANLSPAGVGRVPRRSRGEGGCAGRL